MGIYRTVACEELERGCLLILEISLFLKVVER